MTVAGNRAFFRSIGSGGFGPYVSDGTASGTRLLPVQGDVTGMTAFDGLVYFGLSTSSITPNLYRSDGTDAGTVALTSGFTLSGSGGNSTIAVVTSTKIFFAGRPAASSSGIELCVTDGTPAGTSQVLDINPGSASSNVEWMTVSGSRIFFAATTATSGTELWTSDGTAAGTFMVADLVSGTGSSSPQSLVTLADGRVVFTATTPTLGREIYVTDGTPGGTLLLLDVNPGSASGLSSSSSEPRLIRSGTKVYFPGTHPASGTELYSTNGSPAGTGIVEDYLAGTSSGVRSSLFSLGDGRVVFGASPTTLQLVISDGTAGGTRAVLTDPAAGGLVSTIPISSTEVLVGTAGTGAASRLIRLDLDSLTGQELASGIVFANPVVLGNGSVLFNYSTTVGTNTLGRELGITDGTAAGTRLVLDISPGTLSSIGQGRMYRVGGRVLTNMGSSTSTLNALDWQSLSATQIESSISNASSQLQFEVINGELFYANSATLRATNGTPAGTRTVRTFSGTIVASRRFESKLLVRVSGGVDSGVWISDGTTVGTLPLALRTTSPVFDAFLGFVQISPAEAVFVHTDPIAGDELWVTDGTAAGTRLLADIRPGAASSVPSSPVPLAGGVVLLARTTGTGTSSSDDRLYFVSASGSVALLSSNNYRLDLEQNSVIDAGVLWSLVGNQIVRTDGTPAGTIVVANLPANTNVATAPLMHDGKLTFIRSTYVAAGSPIYLSQLDGTQVVDRLLLTTTGPQTLGAAASTRLSKFGDGLLCIVRPPSPSPTSLAQVNHLILRIDPNLASAQTLFSGPHTSTTTIGIPTIEGGTLYFAGNDGFLGFEPRRLIVDDQPLPAPALSFEFETAQRVVVEFPEAPRRVVAASDFSWTGPNGSPIAFTMTSAGVNRYHLTPLAALPDGNFNVTVSAALSADEFGNVLPADPGLQSFVLAGDMNRDRIVDFDDLLTLAQNYGQTGRTFSQGNIDYSSDGLVGFDDLLLFAQRYGTAQPALRQPVRRPPSSTRDVLS